MVVAVCIKCKRIRLINSKNLCHSCYVMQSKYYNSKECLDKHHEWIVNNRKHVNARTKKWWVDHPEVYEKHKAHMKEYAIQYKIKRKEMLKT